MQMPIIGIRDRRRILPETDQRQPINITREAADQLWHFLNHDLSGTGIGFSEFILHSIQVWREIEGNKVELQRMYGWTNDDPYAQYGTPEHEALLIEEERGT